MTLIDRLSKLDGPERALPVTDVLNWTPATWAIPARRGAFGFVPQGNSYLITRCDSRIDVDQSAIALLRAKEAIHGQ
jgi:hypothetical protein